ncbi:probable serine/threonine-protein kinase At1g01540 [Gastrolobium bilobum]|uniref:probable serine/threonine-protein kinase At1g01540 n=1 Tax=Gastrolobium bilobum TaxID=150636 RepID=UPI002AB3239B|nr:probable serine/threonine-protein kinase At1g01540 [Gastrolobium bilobum]
MVDAEVPDVAPHADMVEPEVEDDDDEDDETDLQDIAELEGGFSLRDVMKGICATLKKIGKMALKHKNWRKSHIQKGNERKPYKPRFSLPKSIPCKHYNGVLSSSSLDKRLLSAPSNASELEMNFEKLSDHRELVLPSQFYPHVSGIIDDGYFKGLESRVKGCGYFSLKMIHDATNGLAKENVIGSGDNGTVYLGLLPNHRRVAVKKLVCVSPQPEEFFASRIEAIGRVKHKKLVKLLGYCTEGAYRMSVSEYIENGNLHHWLHEFPGQISPLTWTRRLNIIHGVAKGLVYLHEEVEPKILHGRIKSSNILLDHQWNPKISDFGLAKLLNPEWSHIIMEALGYVAPQCHSTSTFTEGDDIYDFGLLIMEILSGRTPLDHSEPQDSIVDWFKSMISNGKIANVLDPKLLARPSSKELKRVILVALRCVDPDVNPRIKMGDVARMLETNLLLFEEHQIATESCEHNHSPQSQQD